MRESEQKTMPSERAIPRQYVIEINRTKESRRLISDIENTLERS